MAATSQELAALAAQVQQLEALRRSQADEAQRIINSQRATIERLKLENSKLQDDLTPDAKAGRGRRVGMGGRGCCMYALQRDGGMRMARRGPPFPGRG